MSTNLAAVEHALATRITPRTVTALDAALALYSLNYHAKDDYAWCSPTIYALKSRLLESYWRGGFVFRVTTEPDEVGGWLWLLFVVISGQLFAWHQPPDHVTYALECYDEPLPPWRWPVATDATLHERLEVVRNYLRSVGSAR